MIKKLFLLALLSVSYIIYPQSTEDVTFNSGDITLSGTLYIPKIKTNAPAVIFVHGSGKETRENSIYSAKWFASLGYVVLIYDKRGTGASEGSNESWRYFSLEDLSNDLVSAINYLSKRKEVDKSRIGVHAVSQGGWVSSLASSKTDLISFMIMKSASVSTIEEDRIFERAARLKNEGFSQSDLKEVLRIQLQEKRIDNRDTAQDEFARMFDEYKDRNWFSRVYATNDVNSPSLIKFRKWYATIADFNPAIYLEKTNIPVFWIFGDPDKDDLSPVEKSVRSIKSLKEAGKRYEIKVFSEAGHNIDERLYEKYLYQWLDKIHTAKTEFIGHRSALWFQDFEELYSLLKSEHRYLYHTTPSSIFEKEYEKIKLSIPKLNGHEVMAELARFVALVRDGHTRLTLPLQEGIGLNQAHSSTPPPAINELLFRHLPVAFYWFDDGLYITSATKEYAHLIGRKVNKVESFTTEEAMEKVRPYCHYDNEMGYRLIAAARLSYFELLKAAGIVNSKDKVALTIDSEGKDVTVRLHPLDRLTKKVLKDDISSQFKNQLLSREQKDQFYWYRYLEETKTIYFQLNQMNNDVDGQSLISFLQELQSFMGAKEADRFILDLRNNFGGDNSYSLPIIRMILENSEINQFGRLYALVGRKTFSASQYLANDLSRWTDVIFVGEPTGASPSSYGDARKFQLTNSNLTVRISSVYWRDSSSDENKPWLSPDIPVANNGNDYFNNKDVALNKCLQFKANQDIISFYKRLYETGGINSALRIYFRIATDLRRSDKEVGEIESMLVSWMSQDDLN